MSSVRYWCKRAVAKEIPQNKTTGMFAEMLEQVLYGGRKALLIEQTIVGAFFLLIVLAINGKL
ncbi:hypothetical protein ACQ4M3_23475 [Leptolyngbya sp. AN03gr2]|uniref:hypothetical protein n=1 Tax=unclassified Leptolyngbya TaxID=2650499 RepID=UPI003D30FA42